MIALIFCIIFLLIFIFFCIAGGNYLLRSMIDNVLSKKEGFTNIDNSTVNPVDDCRKMDIITNDTLNFQTSTNIPLSPYSYKNYVGKIYMNDESENMNIINDTDNNSYCMKKPKLLYDGIWEDNIKKDNSYEYDIWNLTNGDLSSGYYCSDKLIQVNKPFPENYVDDSAVQDYGNPKSYMYYNDTKYDVNDTEIQCFPSVFNAGITEDLKKKL